MKFLMLLGYDLSSIGTGFPFASSGECHCTAQYPLSFSGPAPVLSPGIMGGKIPPTFSGLYEKNPSENCD